jgi:hypothetical protein
MSLIVSYVLILIIYIDLLHLKKNIKKKNSFPSTSSLSASFFISFKTKKSVLFLVYHPSILNFEGEKCHLENINTLDLYKSMCSTTEFRRIKILSAQPESRSLCAQTDFLQKYKSEPNSFYTMCSI